MKERLGSGEREREQEITALISLLDDPDSNVTPIVRERLKTLRPNICSLLAVREDCVHNALMTQRLDKVITDQILNELSAWQQEDDPELLKGLWLVYRMVRPHLEYKEMEEGCMDMVKDVWVELSDDKTSVEKVHLYNHVFYHRIGFKVEDPFLSESLPAFLDRALEKKQANPVLFGLLYLDVAYKAGLPIRAMVFPGGFLPVCVDENERVLFYINIYNAGEIFGHEQLAAFLNDFGLSIPKERFFLGDTVTLVATYVESLYFIAAHVGDREMEQKMEQALTLFGDERILIMEEDDE